MPITSSERGGRLPQADISQWQPHGLARQCPQHAITCQCRATGGISPAVNRHRVLARAEGELPSMPLATTRLGPCRCSGGTTWQPGSGAPGGALLRAGPAVDAVCGSELESARGFWE